MEFRVPDAVHASFVIATAHPPYDPVALARARTRPPLAAALLRTPLVRIRTYQTGESGYADLLGHAEAGDPVHKATHHIVVTARIPPVSQPEHGQALRAIARVVAASCDGAVYDPWSRCLLPHDFRFGAEHPEFCLADGWLTAWFARARLTTAGLRRFGLPELEAPVVPRGNRPAAVTLLRCLAVAMLSEHWDWLACNPGAAIRRLPSHAWAEGRDVWRYWACEPAGPVGGRVRVRFGRSARHGPGEPMSLSIGPPADFGASTATWWNDVVDLAMPYVPETLRSLAA
jgi:hypothetical protein